MLGTARQLGLGELIVPVPSRHRDLVTAMAVAQVLAPDSKLAIARGLRDATAASSLGEVLGAGSCDEDDLYAAMDYLAGGTLVLYDVPSAASGGRTCPLGAVGHPGTGCGAGCRSSAGCSPPKTASRSRSRCSPGTPATPRPWPPR